MLERTYDASLNMDTVKPHSADLVTMKDAQMTRLSHTRGFPRAEAPLDVVHMDVVSVRNLDLPAAVDGSRRGLKYGVVFVDDYSKLKRVYFAKEKSDVPGLVRLFFMEMGSHAMYGSHFVMHAGFRQMRIHTDGGKELNSNAMEEVLLEFGLSANVTSSPHTPSSNGVAERAIRTLMRDTVTFMAMSGMSSRHWHWAMRHACAMRNKLASQRVLIDGDLNWMSPHELFFKRRPDLRHAVAFGSPCRVLLMGPERLQQGKIGIPSARGHILGYGGDGIQLDGSFRIILGYIVLLKTGKIVYSRHVQIDERDLVEGGHTPFKLAPQEQEQEDRIEAMPFGHEEEEEERALEHSDEEDGHEFMPMHFEHKDEINDEASEEEPVANSAAESMMEFKNGMENATNDELQLGHDPMRRDRVSRSKTKATMEKNASNDAQVRAVKQIVTPRSYEEAMAQPEATKWKESMEEHMNAHDGLKSFVEVLVPESRRVIPTKWVYALKTNPDGEVVRYKSRFVVKGFMQRAGVDYDEVFSPTIRGEQIRMMVGIGAKHMGVRHKLKGSTRITILGKGDVSNAYLTAPLPEDEDVLFELPRGYVPKLKAPVGQKVVARSVKAQQGLKQSGRVWNKFQHECLLKQGFVQCEIAPCVYCKEVENGYILAGIFVDDILFINMSGDTDGLKKVVRSLSEFYEVKFEEQLEKFLGAEFEEIEEGIYMHLGQYVRDLMLRFDVGEKTESTPESTVQPDENGAAGALLLRADKKEYQAITGSLMFAMTTCRPDIAHAVNMLARKMSAPRACDMEAARRVLRYLNGTQRLGLLFRFESGNEAMLCAFADADWANDKVERRSTTGYVVLLNGTPISWCSGLQSVVALSTCEAEYVALSECCRELAYLRGVMAFLREPIDMAITVYEDNQGTIDLANNPCHHKRSKHIDVKFHYVRSAIMEKKVVVKKVHTGLNRADLMTKAANSSMFSRHVNALMFER
jgi:hypothetical protein